MPLPTVQGFAWRLLVAYVVTVVYKDLVRVILDVDHFLIFTSVSLAWISYRLSPTSVDFDTSEALTFPHTQLLKFRCSTYLRIVWLGMWIVKLTTNYRVLYLNLTLGTSPIILHTNMKILERWPGFCSLSIFSNSRSNLSIPSIFCTALLTGLSCICGMPQLIRLQTLWWVSAFIVYLLMWSSLHHCLSTFWHTQRPHTDSISFLKTVLL